MKDKKFQIGKNGVNEGVADALLLYFKNNKQVRIATLKSSGRDKSSIKKIADDLVALLVKKDKKKKFDYTIIGFTIVLRRRLR